MSTQRPSADEQADTLCAPGAASGRANALVGADDRDAAPDTLDMALAVALVETLPRFSRTLKQSVEQSEGLERLTMPQLQCLQAVAAKGATLAARLAEQMRVTAPTMTTRIDVLVERGLLTRRPDPLNRRQVWLAITPTGRELLTRYQALMEQRVRELLAPLTPEQKERLLVAVGDIGSLLDGLRAHLK